MFVYKKLNCTKWWQSEFLEKEKFLKRWQKSDSFFYLLKGFLDLIFYIQYSSVIEGKGFELRVYRTITK